MSRVTQRGLTIEEYLTYNDGTDIRYEFDDGELVEMPPAIRLHRLIAQFLEDCFRQEIQRLGVGWETGRTDVGVKTKKQNGKTTVCYPDLMVFDGSNANVSEVDIIDFAPLLALEIVSAGARNRRRDYEEKRDEYGIRGIKEYWIIDPEYQKITVLLWDQEGNFYEQEEYRGSQTIPCKVFPNLQLTVKQILTIAPSANIGSI